jgi:hypothetical protein
VESIWWSQVKFFNAAILADLNGDNKPDLITADPEGVSVRPNVGGKFGEFSAYVTGTFHSLVAGDFNGDGYVDIAAAGPSGVRILLGNGAGSVTPAGEFTLGISRRENGVLAAADFNGDGSTDLAVLTADGNLTTLLTGAASTTSTLSTTAGATVVFGTAVPLKLQVTPSGMAFSEPSGTVTFYDGVTKLGEITQTTSTYQFSAVNLTPGVHQLTAKYAGNARTVGSTSNLITIEVVVKDSTSSGTGAASPFESPGLAQNQLLRSPNKKYEARMQSDGNFVIYGEGKAIWSTQTQGRQQAPYRLAVQPDGNLMIYGSSSQDVTLPGFGVCRAGSPCIATWSTGKRGGTAPYTLKMQDDGNLVMYDSANRAVWNSGTQR